MRLVPLSTFLPPPNRRAAARNFSWLLVDRFVRLVLNVGVGFWVARHLGPQDFGTLVFAASAVAMVQPLAEMGLEAIVRREFVSGTRDVAELAGAAIAVRFFGGALALIVAIASFSLGWADPGERPVVWVFTLLLLQPSFAVPELWLQAGLQARAVVPLQWLTLAAGAVARVLLVYRGAPLIAFAWVAVAESGLGAALVARSAFRRGFLVARPAWRVVRPLIRESWPLMLSGFATLAYMRLDVVMLRRIGGAADAGVYAAATRLTELWYFLPMAVAASLLPSLMRARAENGATYLRELQSYYDLNVAMAYAIAVPLTLARSWLVRSAYGAAYVDAVPVLAISAWSLPFVFLGVARGQFLTTEGHTRFYLSATGAGLVVNIALNLILIPRSGAVGAAWATLAAQMMAAWLSTFCFAPTRPNASLQSRALIVPIRWLTHVRSHSS